MINSKQDRTACDRNDMIPHAIDGCGLNHQANKQASKPARSTAKPASQHHLLLLILFIPTCGCMHCQRERHHWCRVQRHLAVHHIPAAIQQAQHSRQSAAVNICQSDVLFGRSRHDTVLRKAYAAT
jgi:hypothetical protein